MSKRIAIAVILVVTLLTVAIVVQMMRYEYYYSGHLRIDRLTGQHQYHCIADNDWKISESECRRVTRNQLIENEGSLPLSNPDLFPQKKCLSKKEFIADSEKRGFKCTGESLGYPECVKDSNGNGIDEPWERDYIEKGTVTCF